MIAGNGVWRLTRIVAIVASLVFSPLTMADWQADPDDKKQVKAEAAIARVKEKVPQCSWKVSKSKVNMSCHHL